MGGSTPTPVVVAAAAVLTVMVDLVECAGDADGLFLGTPRQFITNNIRGGESVLCCAVCVKACQYMLKLIENKSRLENSLNLFWAFRTNMSYDCRNSHKKMCKVT